MDRAQLQQFREVVWEYYGAHGRYDLPWRQPKPGDGFAPYTIVVSELMLQQTQVARVVAKYPSFLDRFGSFTELAQSPLSEVLQAWDGLGYNRRAKFLWQTAQVVMREYNGRLPDRLEELTKLPGIGPNTAGAIQAYAFNYPAVFVETNIRTVFIHHFFAREDRVTDAQIRALVQATLPEEPRQWYWALMDYGTYLKQAVGNTARQSASYNRQSAFEGSRRQIRGQVLRTLGDGPLELADLQADNPDERLPDVVQDLLEEGFIHRHKGRYHLGDA